MSPASGCCELLLDFQKDVHVLTIVEEKVEDSCVDFLQEEVWTVMIYLQDAG